MFSKLFASFDKLVAPLPEEEDEEGEEEETMIREREAEIITTKGGQLEFEIPSPDTTTTTTSQKQRKPGFSLWQLVAPDPNFASMQSDMNSDLQQKDAVEKDVNLITSTLTSVSLLQHDTTTTTQEVFLTPTNKSTSVVTTAAAGSTKLTSPFPSSYVKATPNSWVSPTPTKQRLPPTEEVERRRIEDSEQVDRAVLLTSRKVIDSITSPKPYWEKQSELFRMCNWSSLPKEANVKKMTKILEKNSDWLYTVSTKMDGIPNGYYPLHVAALRNNLQAAEILIRIAANRANELLEQRTNIGFTALHIAAEEGNLEMIRFLKAQWKEVFGTFPCGWNAPRSIEGMTGGMTPMACAYLSLGTKKDLIRQIENELLQPGDWSICPASTTKKMGDIHTAASLQLSYSSATRAGRRGANEDTITIVCPLLEAKQVMALFGVFDGHADGQVMSQYVAENIPKCLADTQEWQQPDMNPYEIGEALKHACIQVDQKMREELGPKMDGGSTGIIAIVTSSFIVVGNVGDSRAILVKSSARPGSVVEVVPLSQDHKADLVDERARIEKAGLKVEEIEHEGTTYFKVLAEGKKRTALATTRAFGDYDFKLSSSLPPEQQALVPLPEIVIYERDLVDDLFLILACDGIWDVMTNEECAKFVVECAETDLEEKCNLLLDECFDKGTADNMSVIIASLSAASASSAATELFPANDDSI